MARETVYRLRRHRWSESFCAAWDAALGKPVPLPLETRKVTTAELQWRLDSGLWRVRLYRGKFVGAGQEPDNSALYGLLARFSRHAAAPPVRVPRT